MGVLDCAEASAGVGRRENARAASADGDRKLGSMDAKKAAELQRRREAAQAVFAALFKAQEAAAAAAHASGAGCTLTKF